MRFGPGVYHNIRNRNARTITFLMGIVFALWFVSGIIDVISNSYEKMNFFTLLGLNGGLQASLACFFIYRLLVLVYDIPRAFTHTGVHAFKVLAIELGSLWLITFLVVIFTPFGMYSGTLFTLALLSYLAYRITNKITIRIDNSNTGDFGNVWRFFR